MNSGSDASTAGTFIQEQDRPEPALLQAAGIALANSRYVARAAAVEASSGDDGSRCRWLAANAVQAWDAQRFDAWLQADRRAHESDSPDRWLAGALRRLRRRVLLAVIVRDVAGGAGLDEVTGTMTALAEFAVQRSLAVLGAETVGRYGVPADETGAPQDLLVLAMGKGGGNELNVSSDLDLIFVYDAEGATTSPSAPISNQEFFERLGRRLIGLLSDAGDDGFVFRVDMRLRPNGDSGPLVVSTSMLEEYLARQGREWERFAWLKARVISAPVFAGAGAFAAQAASLEACVRPFVYRRYLDFNSLGALRELHAKIRQQTRRRAAGRVDARDHVKLGRGGIREIEFIAQTFQVMRGGREARLRSRSTLQTLRSLGELGVLDRAECAALADRYVSLRRLEHALQYVDDAQTHLIPTAIDERRRVAALLGEAGGSEAMMARYEADTAVVAASFDRIFAAPARSGVSADSGAGDWAQRFAPLGLAQVEDAARRAAALLASPRVAAWSEAGRERLAHLLAHAVPMLGAAASQGWIRAGATVDELLARWLQLLEVIAGRTTYVALLDEYPQALARVLRLLGTGRWPSDYLMRHPVLLDELLGAAGEDEGAGWVARLREWAQGIDAELRAAGDDTERAMNLLRDAHHAQVFRLLLADMDGRLGPPPAVEDLADRLSALADATIDLCLAAVWRQMRGDEAPPPAICVVSYGKLGGKELGYASDLDLIFVYEDPDPDAATVYAQLVRRFVTWVTTPTSSGVLFDIDLRLRPNGNAGLLVSALDAFTRYQLGAGGQGAWTWEHQALTRARACAGDRALGLRIEELRRQVLARPRDAQALAAEVVSMRARMLQGHPNRSAMFDLKHDRGGMVDIEFAVQFLVLAYASRHAELLGNLGNIALLRIAARLGLVDAALAEASAQAYRRYRQLQHGLRLNGAEYSRIERAEVAPQAEAVLALWRAVLGTAAPEP